MNEQDLKKYVLADDPASDFGGISYVGETADNLVLECHDGIIPKNYDLHALRYDLEQSGCVISKVIK